MKGSTEVVEFLNQALAGELAASNQYLMHAKLHESRGYAALGEKTREEAIEELKHAEAMIDRILLLGGHPEVRASEVVVGSNIRDQLHNDLKVEMAAVQLLNRGIDLCGRIGDAGTRVMLESMLVDEETHVDWLEKQLSMIEHVGIQNYLLRQAG